MLQWQISALNFQFNNWNKPLNNDLLFEESVGYQIRQTHRYLQRYLQQKIEPYGITPGMWYFLRALWYEDGLTQRELSNVVGTMEPTTLAAIKSMESIGLIERKRNAKDRRKINVFLTPKGISLKDELLPMARNVVHDALKGFADEQREALFEMLTAIQTNLEENKT